MNSFQVKQVAGRPTNNRHYSRILTSFAVMAMAFFIGAVFTFSSSTSLVGFAQNLPKPQQVLGEATSSARCEGKPYEKPAAISLNSHNLGLSYREDAPQFYNLYGAGLKELRTAVTDCEVRKQTGDYHALTTYTLNWQYDTQASAGQCTLANVKIGLATNQYLPRLAENQALPTQDRATWDTYYTNLLQHEDEHLALDKKYAADLHYALSQLSAPCSTIEAHVATVINSHLQLLNAANSMLDTQTNHGADTGAIL